MGLLNESLYMSLSQGAHVSCSSSQVSFIGLFHRSLLQVLFIGLFYRSFSQGSLCLFLRAHTCLALFHVFFISLFYMSLLQVSFIGLFYRFFYRSLSQGAYVSCSPFSTCDMTHLCVWRVLCTRAADLVHMKDMPHSYV